MATTENIISGVILIALVLAFSGYITYNVTDDLVNQRHMEFEAFQKDQYESNFKAILDIDEPISNTTFGVLLGDALYLREEVLNHKGYDINMTEKLKYYLDLTYGEGNYYFTASPTSMDIELNFIMDGSDSLNAEREEIANKLPQIIEETGEVIKEEQNGKITAKTYILGKDRDKCKIFTDQNIDCKTIADFEMYYDEESFVSVLNTFKEENNLTKPYDQDALKKAIATPSYYYDSDWAFGSAYASYISKTENPSQISIIFPVTDELSTSSIPDECMTKTDAAEWVLCAICSSECPASRSMTQVEKATNVLKNNNHIAYPIFSFNCDYDYDSIWSQLSSSQYGSPVDGYWCNSPQCNGCSVKDGDNVCFHPDCRDDISSQMEYMAENTNGEVIDLENIAEIKDRINYAIEKSIEDFNITIGEKKEDERYGYAEELPMSQGLVGDIRLWVYKDAKKNKPVVTTTGTTTTTALCQNTETIKPGNYDKYNPPWPRTGIFQFGGAPDEFYAKYDFLMTRNPHARISEIDADTILIKIHDINAGTGDNKKTEEWIMRDEDGKYVPCYGESMPFYDISEYCPSVDGETYREYVFDFFKNAASPSYMDGVGTDGIWGSWYGNTKLYSVDLDRDGSNDEWDYVKTVIRQSTKEVISGIRDKIGDKLFLTQGTVADKFDLVNGYSFEYGQPFISDWYSGIGEYNKYMNQLREPNIIYMDGNGGWWTDPYQDNKDKFDIMRFSLGTSMLGNGYYGYQNTYKDHYALSFYDEFELNLGYPKGNIRTIDCEGPNWRKECIFIRFFDNGILIINAKGEPVTVTDEDLQQFTDQYDGPYYRFRGSQDPEWNNGEEFRSRDMNGEKKEGGSSTLFRYMGDTLILVNTPTTVVSDIIIDHSAHVTSPGNNPAELSDYYLTCCTGDTDCSTAWTNGCRYSYVGNNIWDQECEKSDPKTLGCNNQYWKDKKTIRDSHDMAVLDSDSASATFRPTINVPGEYEIFEWHPDIDNAGIVKYEIEHQEGTETGTIDQGQNTGKWNSLGKFNLEAGETSYVKLTPESYSSGDMYIADAVKFVYQENYGAVKNYVVTRDKECNAESSESLKPGEYDKFNPPYPRRASFDWGSGNPENFGRFDLLMSAIGTISFAERVRSVNPDIILLRTSDWMAGGGISIPDEWIVHDSRGNDLTYYSKYNMADLSDYALPSAKYDNMRFNEYLPEYLYNKLGKEYFEVYDGIASDGVWRTIVSSITDFDLNRDGENDYEGRKTWVMSAWQAGIRKIVSRLRELMPENKVVLLNNGIFFRGEYSDAINGMINEHCDIAIGCLGCFINWYDIGLRNSMPEPHVLIYNPRPKYKEDYSDVRFTMGMTLMGDIYLAVEDLEIPNFEDDEVNWGDSHHHQTNYYDEYDVNLGYPTTEPIAIKQSEQRGDNYEKGIYVRFFDNGVVILNGYGVPNTVTDAELQELEGYDGPYYRFKGGQDSNFNNGELFESVTLNGESAWCSTIATYGDCFKGDSVILLKSPTTAISDIIIDNDERQSSPGALDVEYNNDDLWSYEGREYSNNRQVICDQISTDEDKAPYFEYCSPVQDHYPLRYSEKNGAEAIYRFNINVPGTYKIYEWHGDINILEETNNAIYELHYNEGVDTFNIDQTTNVGHWNLLGEYELEEGTSQYIKISDANDISESVLIADAIKLVYQQNKGYVKNHVVTKQESSESREEAGKACSASHLEGIEERKQAWIDRYGQAPEGGYDTRAERDRGFSMAWLENSKYSDPAGKIDEDVSDFIDYTLGIRNKAGFFGGLTMVRYLIQYPEKLKQSDIDKIKKAFDFKVTRHNEMNIRGTQPEKGADSLVYIEHFSQDARFIFNEYWPTIETESGWSASCNGCSGTTYQTGEEYSSLTYTKDVLKRQMQHWVFEGDSEMDSGYANLIVDAFLLIRDHSKDEDMRRRAKMVIDFMMLEQGMEFSGRQKGAPWSIRTYKTFAVSNRFSFRHSYPLLGIGPDWSGGYNDHAYATSYIVPELIKDVVDVSDEPADYWHIHKENNGVMHDTGTGKWTFVTPHYTIGAAKSARPAWQVTINSDSDVRAFKFWMNGKANDADEDYDSANGQTAFGGNGFHQYRNAFLYEGGSDSHLHMIISSGEFDVGGDQIIAYPSTEFEYDNALSGDRKWYFFQEGKTAMSIKSNAGGGWGIELATIGNDGDYRTFDDFKNVVEDNAELAGPKYYLTSEGYRIDRNDELIKPEETDPAPIWGYPFKRIETVYGYGDEEKGRLIDWENGVMKVSKDGKTCIYDFNNWNYSGNGCEC